MAQEMVITSKTNGAIVQGETLEQKVARLERENASLQSQVASQATEGLRIKIARKTGTISVYGVGRFPMSAFATQWVKVLMFLNKELIPFLKVNEGKYATKGVNWTPIPKENTDPAYAKYQEE